MNSHIGKLLTYQNSAKAFFAPPSNGSTMNVRTRLSVTWLESRETPSGPTPIDPVGDPTPPPPDPGSGGQTNPPDPGDPGVPPVGGG